MILDGNPPRAFGSAGSTGSTGSTTSTGETIAIARAHLSGDWLGLSAVWTHPDQRGRGFATA